MATGGARLLRILDDITLAPGVSSSIVAGGAGAENLTNYPQGGHTNVAFFVVLTAFSGSGTLRVNLQHAFTPGSARRIQVANKQTITEDGTHVIPMATAFNNNTGKKVAIPHISRVSVEEFGGANSITFTGRIYAIFGD